MSTPETVSVIIPTQGLPERQSLFWRAVESVISQEGVRAVPLVVLNGDQTDPTFERRLESDGRLRVVWLPEASLPKGLRAGREAVDSPWFGELDDDDILLKGALATRLAVLTRNPAVDVVVTNGIRRGPAGDTLHVDDMASVERDPLRALIHANWLLPGSWLGRTDTVGAQIFQNIPPFMECTFLAVQFVTRLNTRFLPEPTIVWHTDTPASASKSQEYVLAGYEGLRRILETDLPPDVRHEYRGRISTALHGAAERYRAEGRLVDAWRSHLASLRWPGGLRYLPYTGRLLLPLPPP